MNLGFDTTNWKVVLEAAGDSDTSRAALSALCEAYWYPVYAFIRRQGNARADAEDLTQAYFARFLEKRYLKDVRPEAGRFRAFLLVSVKHFLSNQRDHAHALKRGGGQQPLSLDTASGEARYLYEPVDGVNPEVLFERSRASAVLQQALDALEAEVRDTEGAERFARLKPHLTGEATAETYERIAGELGVTESAVRVGLHRLRQRFGAVLRREVERTVADPFDVDEELRYLLSIVAGPS
jgi:RNA polymerase sigma-70 factor (ECF subfamily)